MNRRQTVVVATIGAAVGVAVLVLLVVRRRQLDTPAIPDWLKVQQPPETVTPDLMILTPDQSWAANRCRPMTACCGDLSAGRRIRRTYPPSLAESPDSFIRLSFDLGGGL